MHIFVDREPHGPDAKATLGRLYLNGEDFCNTLEPRLVNPPVKVYSQTAIPSGLYLITLIKYFLKDGTFRVLPHINNIPYFTRVFIQRLNRVEETMGCIGVGFQRGQDGQGPVIWESAKAESALMARLIECEKREPITLLIKDNE